MQFQKTQSPPGPQGLASAAAPPGLRYQIYAVLVLVALFGFFAFYLGALAGAAYLLIALFSYKPAWSQGVVFWALFATAGVTTLVIFFFLLKGLFKRQRADYSNYLEITAADQPRLFEFLEALCRKTGAPMPHRVFLCSDVNAGVFFDSSLLSLFWPVKKNLLIGLGLINTLNRTEFEAVLAHEFGHFSQRTMRLSNYVYLVHSVLHHMVHGHDRIDDVLARWRGQYLGMFGLAWVLSGLRWLVRRTMGGCLRVITVLDAALSRQMEFHADRVAVQVTGSDAIVHALHKTDYAHQCMMQTLYDLRQAAGHGLFTRDVFFHHSRALEFMRHAKGDMTLGVAPRLPDDENEIIRLFPDSETTVTSMWSSHPSYAEREANAKRHYVRSHIDERSPWDLIEGAGALREELTRRLDLYLELEAGEFLVPAVVQAYIDEEHAEIIFDRKYLGMYDNRFIELDDLDPLIEAAQAQPVPAPALVQRRRTLYGEELGGFMAAFKNRIEELQMLETVIEEQPRWGKTFVFRGQHYRPSEARELFSRVFSEMEDDRRWFADVDQQIFRLHYAMACLLDEATRDELVERYHFVLASQFLLRELRTGRTRLERVLTTLTHTELSEEQVDYVFDTVLSLHGHLAQGLAIASEIPVPALNNVTAGARLAEVLLDEPLIDDEKPRNHELDSTWLRTFVAQYDEVLARLAHLRRKSLGSLLFFQEDIARRLERAD